MKKIIFLSLAVSMIIFSSCNESFIVKDPPLSVESDDVFTSVTRIEANLLGLYASLKMDNSSRALLGGKMKIAFDNRGEDFINISNNLVTLYAAYLMQTGDSDSEAVVYWSVAYRAINNVNHFLERIEGAKDVLGDDALYARYIAEAKFVRAMAYYYLCMMYSKEPYSINPNAHAVPLRRIAEKDGFNNDLGVSSISTIFNFVLEDLKDEYIASLPAAPATPTYASVSRATKGAALMLRMRVKMAMNNWDGAIADGAAVTGYSLTPTVTAPFAPSYRTVENIFSFPMESNNMTGTQYGYVEYYYGSVVIMVLNMSAPGILSEAAYSQPGDARFSELTEVIGDNRRLRKFPLSSKLDWIPIFRYAETLLNLAESYAAKGDAASETQARTLLKQVRRRAIAETDDVIKDADIDALTGSALKDAIYKERRLEFLGEGIRGIDIVRRGESFPAKGTGAQEVGAVSPSNDNYMWPIPSSEKAINKLWNQLAP